MGLLQEIILTMWPTEEKEYSSFKIWKIGKLRWDKYVDQKRHFDFKFDSLVPGSRSKKKWNLQVQPDFKYKADEVEDVERNDRVVRVVTESVDFHGEMDFQCEIWFRFLDREKDYRNIYEDEQVSYSKFNELELDVVDGLVVNGAILRNLKYGKRELEKLAERNDNNLYLEFCFKFSENVEEYQKFADDYPAIEFVDNIAKFVRSNPDSADITIACEGVESKVHKLLLVSQSEIFAAMFEHETQEMLSNRVEIEDSNAKAVENMVSYLYSAVTPTGLEINEVLDLVHLSSKYMLEPLLAGCKDLMESMMSPLNIVKILIVVDRHELGPAMRNIVLDFMKQNIKSIMEEEDWALLMREYPGLVNDFILSCLNINDSDEEQESEASPDRSQSGSEHS